MWFSCFSDAACHSTCRCNPNAKGESCSMQSMGKDCDVIAVGSGDIYSPKLVENHGLDENWAGLSNISVYQRPSWSVSATAELDADSGEEIISSPISPASSIRSGAWANLPQVPRVVPRHRLLVTSDGLSTPALREEFRTILCVRGGSDISRKSAWYIPTAALGEGADASVISNACQQLVQLGLKEVKSIDVAQVTGADLEKHLATLTSLDCIYLEMGNTYFLRHHLRKSGAESMIQRAAADGVLIVGASAGSICLGRTVQTAFWKNWDNRTCLGIKDVWSDKTMAAGLDLAGGRSFVPHANGPFSSQAWQIEQARTHGHTDHEVVCLPDGHGFVLDGDLARVL
eukprot:TRINITY_DN93813_c0_g1_i1.p1 TRINITY_DN93813_c0_g1~~TRINITY_DN93813_c0_g1_i1.p1  ORF type:complete len:344 (-),score=52.16 TRINITY_DN93813_c0_g1_i1:171-1202(-)